MALPRALLQCVCSILLFASSIQALKFDLVAHPRNAAKQERCIRNFVAKDTLVVVTATVSGRRGDGMVVNMEVRRGFDAEGGTRG
jgi:p24 family protein delta-1